MYFMQFKITIRLKLQFDYPWRLISELSHLTPQKHTKRIKYTRFSFLLFIYCNNCVQFNVILILLAVANNGNWNLFM